MGSHKKGDPWLITASRHKFIFFCAQVTLGLRSCFCDVRAYLEA